MTNAPPPPGAVCRAGQRPVAQAAAEVGGVAAVAGGREMMNHERRFSFPRLSPATLPGTRPKPTASPVEKKLLSPRPDWWYDAPITFRRGPKRAMSPTRVHPDRAA